MPEFRSLLVGASSDQANAPRRHFPSSEVKDAFDCNPPLACLLCSYSTSHLLKSSLWSQCARFRHLSVDGN